MSRDVAAMRALLAAGVRANPVVRVEDPALLARLDDPAGDCGFEALGFDSLARMELCIWLQLEAGIEIAENEIAEHPSVAALAAWLAARQT